MGSTFSSTVSRLPSWLLRRTVGGAAKQTDAAAWHLFLQAAAATVHYRTRPMLAEASITRTNQAMKRAGSRTNPTSTMIETAATAA